MANYPTEPKVQAAAAGAGAGAIIAGFLVWGIDGIWYDGGNIDVPLPVTGFVTLVVSAGLAWFAGYRARHVERGAATPPPAPPVP